MKKILHRPQLRMDQYSILFRTVKPFGRCHFSFRKKSFAGDGTPCPGMETERPQTGPAAIHSHRERIPARILQTVNQAYKCCRKNGRKRRQIRPGAFLVEKGWCKGFGRYGKSPPPGRSTKTRYFIWYFDAQTELNIRN